MVINLGKINLFIIGRNKCHKISTPTINFYTYHKLNNKKMFTSYLFYVIFVNVEHIACRF